MKFIAAFLASASATAYVTCDTSIAYYGSTDTTCTSTVSGTDAVKAIVDQCTYSITNTAWFKITDCTLTTAKLQWHTTAACSDTPAAAQKTDFTAAATCLVGAKTGTAAGFYSKITAPTSITSAALCAFTIANYSENNACTTAAAYSTTMVAMGMNGGPWVVGQCYFMMTGKYFKITVCSAANTFTVTWWTEVTCAATAASPANNTCTGSCTDHCASAVFGGATSWKVSAVVHTHTVTATAAAPVVAAAVVAGSKTLVTGALAAVSMMYL